MQDNQVILAGYLGDKPELRYLPSGTPVANVCLAQSYEYEYECDKDRKTEGHTNWFNLVFYGGLAAVAMKFNKGDNIHVTAVLERRQWETKTGGKRTVYEVIVHKCHRIASLAEPDKPTGNDGQSHPDSDLMREQEMPGAYGSDDWVI
jgi:single-strand DNA-binding protein